MFYLRVLGVGLPKIASGEVYWGWDMLLSRGSAQNFLEKYRFKAPKNFFHGKVSFLKVTFQRGWPLNLECASNGEGGRGAFF